MEVVEVWKDIDGYDGDYQISNLGRLKSKKKANELIMKPMVATNGYLIACLWKNNKQRKFCIHILVAKAFIPNPNGLLEINHKDENKTNNCVENLEWCTHLYNMNYGNLKEKISNSNKRRIVTNETKQKLREDTKNRRWINNGVIEKYIPKEQLSDFLEKDWRKGRIYTRRSKL